jgi:hypothetical protein
VNSDFVPAPTNTLEVPLRLAAAAFAGLIVHAGA